MLIAGAAVSLIFAIWLTWYGIDYARGGCDCDDPLFAPWWGWVLVGVAVPAYVAAAALIVRALRAQITLTTEQQPSCHHRR
jgi:hypothetical protein